MKFTLPTEFLPEEEHQRYQVLQEYFCDQRGQSYYENGQWVVDLYWPSEKEYFVDPLITEGISWWNPSLALQNSYQQFREMPGYQLSLNDSWTLYSWSKWISKQIRTEGFPEEIILLHVDYHNDLMSPRLGYTNNVYNDLITGNIFDIKEPESVYKAILSGAIGVGSFIVPLLHEVKKVHLRHLCDSHLTKKKGLINQLKKEWENDTLLALDQIRPKVNFVQEDYDTDPNDDLISYKITNNIQEWLDNLPNVPILLHIDMDYFNCRYDGDSDWQKNLPRHDPSPLAMEDNMKKIFNAISTKGLGGQIKDITVALSPGFYPAEFWKIGIEKISELIQFLIK